MSKNIKRYHTCSIGTSSSEHMKNMGLWLYLVTLYCIVLNKGHLKTPKLKK